MQGFNVEHLQEKWAPVLDHDGLGNIQDSHKRMVTAVLLENQEKALREEREFLSETPTNSGNAVDGSGAFGGTANAPVAGFDPVLISLIRRSMPNLLAYDLAGVQPMNGPTGLIFAMRSRYTGQTGPEAMFDEADTTFSGARGTQTATGIGVTNTASSENNPGVLNDSGTYTSGSGMKTGDSEALGSSASGALAFNEMAFSIEKVTVTANSRALKAEYSLELAQDLKAIHGLNAEAELANILSTEILAEINREMIRTIYRVAEEGAQDNVANAGTFDLDVDSNGRWSV